MKLLLAIIGATWSLLLVTAEISTAQPCQATAIIKKASDYMASKNIQTGNWGDGVINSVPPDCKKETEVEYQMANQCPTKYLIKVTYAAKDPRPVFISIIQDKNVVFMKECLNDTTGGWEFNHQKEIYCEAGPPDLPPAVHPGPFTLKIYRKGCFPHISTIILTPTK